MPELVADTVAGVLREATATLADSSETARLDAELLLSRVLGVRRERFVTEPGAAVEGSLRDAYTALVARRAAGEPVAYLIGRRGFRRLELAVDAHVLIPRPETEGLVEVGLELPAGASVLDVGTGSGAVALALADERPDLRVSGVDVSSEAVALARANGMDLCLDVSFTVGDLLDGAAPVDAVLANLPYVRDDAPLPVDVAGYEPALALYGGADGLVVIRRLLAQVAARPWPALIALEIGETQGAAVTALVRAAGFERVEVRRDLAGRDRIVVGERERERGREPERERGRAP